MRLSALMCFYTSFHPALTSCQGGVKCSTAMGCFLLDLLVQLRLCMHTFAATIKEQVGVPAITRLLHCFLHPTGEAHIKILQQRVEQQACLLWGSL